MTNDQQKRLADIRMRLQLQSLSHDTSGWESTFFLAVIEEKNEEIRRLKQQLAEAAQVVIYRR